MSVFHLKTIPLDAVTATLQGEPAEAKALLAGWAKAASVDGPVFLCSSGGVTVSLDLASTVSDEKNWNASSFSCPESLEAMVEATDVAAAAEELIKTFFRFGGEEAHFPVGSVPQLVAASIFSTTNVALQVNSTTRRIDDKTGSDNRLVVRLAHTHLRDQANWTGEAEREREEGTIFPSSRAVA